MNKTTVTEEGFIPDYYKGRSIFITGASGLMGKVLIERLLYFCPELANIYMLVRPKRGKSVDTRIDEMQKLPVSTSFSFRVFLYAILPVNLA